MALFIQVKFKKSLFIKIRPKFCWLAITPLQKISRLLWNTSLFCKSLLDFVSPNLKLHNQYLAPWVFAISPGQSHYIEVVQRAIFMEQNMRFGLILGRLAILKKKLGTIMSNFLGRFFHVFMGKKISFFFKNTVACFWIFWGAEKFTINCAFSTGDTSVRDFYMTLLQAIVFSYALVSFHQTLVNIALSWEAIYLQEVQVK